MRTRSLLNAGTNRLTKRTHAIKWAIARRLFSVKSAAVYTRSAELRLKALRVSAWVQLVCLPGMMLGIIWLGTNESATVSASVVALAGIWSMAFLAMIYVFIIPPRDFRRLGKAVVDISARPPRTTV